MSTIYQRMYSMYVQCSKYNKSILGNTYAKIQVEICFSNNHYNRRDAKIALMGKYTNDNGEMETMNIQEYMGKTIRGPASNANWRHSNQTKSISQ